MVLAVQPLLKADAQSLGTWSVWRAVDLRGSRPRCVRERGLNGTRLLHRCYAGVLLRSLFVPKQSRRTCPDLGEAKPGVSLPYLCKRSEWVALSRPGPEHVGPRFGPRGPLWRGGGLPMTLRDQRVFARCLGGCDPGAQSCCPRSARDDGLTDPDNGPDAVRHARSPVRLPGCAAER
jgi:hypothetical protein